MLFPRRAINHIRTVNGLPMRPRTASRRRKLMLNQSKDHHQAVTSCLSIQDHPSFRQVTWTVSSSSLVWPQGNHHHVLQPNPPLQLKIPSSSSMMTVISLLLLPSCNSHLAICLPRPDKQLPSMAHSVLSVQQSFAEPLAAVALLR